MLCYNTMGDDIASRPRRISISTQRANSSPMLYLNAIKKSTDKNTVKILQ